MTTDLRGHANDFFVVIGQPLTFTLTTTTDLSASTVVASVIDPTTHVERVALSATKTVVGADHIITVVASSAQTTTLGVSRSRFFVTVDGIPWFVGFLIVGNQDDPRRSRTLTTAFTVTTANAVDVAVTVIGSTGGGGGSSAAADITIVDAGAMYTATNVEAALAEVKNVADTAAGGGITLEQVQDDLGNTSLLAGTSLTKTYDDAANTITLNVDAADFDPAGSAAAAQSASQPLAAVLTNTTASFLTADETKLDGIAAGAQVNDAAAAILTKLLTVDGAGSGLDADLLDGISSAGFATSAQGALAASALQTVAVPASITATGTASASTFLRGDGAWASPAGGGGGDLLAANNLSDLANAATGRTNLGVAIGTNVQAFSAVLAATTASFLTADETKLDAIEALADVTDTANVTAAGALMNSEVDADIKTLVLPASTTISAFGATLVDDADNTAARTTLGLGTAATTAATAYATAAQGTTADAALPMVAAGASVENVGAIEENTEVASVVTTKTADTSLYGSFVYTMTGACTFTFSNPAPTTKRTTFVLTLIGAFTPTLPAAVKWSGGAAPTYTGTGSGSVYVFTTTDAGTTWYAVQSGAGFA